MTPRVATARANPPPPDSFDGNGVVRVSFRKLVNPTPRQLEFWRVIDRCRFTLYGGARGGGKSYILRWTAVRFLLRWFPRLVRYHRAELLRHGEATPDDCRWDSARPTECTCTLCREAVKRATGIRVGIFCESYPELWDRQISKVRREFPDWLGRYNGQTHEFELHPQYGGGVICFRNLADPKQYLSAEFAAIFVDELTQNPIETFNDLIGSLRWPGIERCVFAGATNPGGPGHAWVKDVWVDGGFSMEETRQLVEPDPDGQSESWSREDFGYVRALATDNPHNPRSYIRMLNGLPPRLRAAYRDGNWDVFEGMAFPEWDARYHTMKPYRVPSTWRTVAGLDWGYRKGHYALAALTPEGDIEIIWELYFGADNGLPLHAEEAAAEIMRRSAHFRVPDYIAYDDQMDQDAGLKAGMTLLKEFRKGLLRAFGGNGDVMPRLVPAAKGPGSRRTKKDAMHKYLKVGTARKKDAEGNPTEELEPWARPRLRFHRGTVSGKYGAPHAIRAISALPLDPDNPEDVDTDAEDHPYDAVCNILLSRPPLEEQEPADPDANQHPGIDPVKKRRRRKFKRPSDYWESDESEQRWSPSYELPSTQTVPYRG
jgi:hypothetical protein